MYWHCDLCQYKFVILSSVHKQAKDVTHIWELGGGTFLSKLAEVPITQDSIRYVQCIGVYVGKG